MAEINNLETRVINKILGTNTCNLYTFLLHLIQTGKEVLSMEKILIIEEITVDDFIVDELKNVLGVDIEFQRIFLEEVLSGQIRSGTLFVTSLQVLGKNKQEVMDALELLAREDNFRLFIGEIPETIKTNPSMIIAITQLYRILAYKDYQTRRVNQMKKLTELKGDAETIQGFGRPKKVSMEEFANVYKEVLDGKITNAAAQSKLHLSKRSYYKYKNKFEE